MPRAEAGSLKALNNKMKSKGLQRLRWYCQVCERQMRDENGFKMHTQSESHVRAALVKAEDPNKAINEYSQQFQREFLQQLRTAHGTKAVHINHFYQEYIAYKEHVHMNATRWPSLTEFAKFLGREGICRVEETDKGLHVAWIDNSPENLRRQDALRKRERMDRGDEEREQKLIQEQIERAQKAAQKTSAEEDDDENRHMLHRQEGQKIKLSFGSKQTEQDKPVSTPSQNDTQASAADALHNGNPEAEAEAGEGEGEAHKVDLEDKAAGRQPAAAPKVSFGTTGASSKSKNVFAAGSKKNLLGGKRSLPVEQPRKMSEVERIMKEEMDRKKSRSGSDFNGLNAKRIRTA